MEFLLNIVGYRFDVVETQVVFTLFFFALRDAVAEVLDTLLRSIGFLFSSGFLFGRASVFAGTSVLLFGLLANAFFPSGQVCFVDTFFNQLPFYTDDVVDGTLTEFTHFGRGFDTDGLGIVASHQEDLAASMFADMGTYAFENHHIAGCDLILCANVIDG